MEEVKTSLMGAICCTIELIYWIYVDEPAFLRAGLRPGAFRKKIMQAPRWSLEPELGAWKPGSIREQYRKWLAGDAGMKL